MTVTYTSEVVTSRRFSIFIKLLLRWRGSIYKLIWRDLLVYLAFYYTIYFSYKFAMEGKTKSNFEMFVKYCKEYRSFIPLSFVLGFYVTIVMDRWWAQYTSIPFPDNIAILLSASIKNKGDKGRLVRRTIVRYACLSFTITMTMMCPRVLKRFPTWDHFIEAGLMTVEEKEIFEELHCKYNSTKKYWLPLAWATNVITRSREEGLIVNDVSVRNLFEEIFAFRGKCGGLLDYDWISIPLVYTQVVTIAVHAFNFTGLFAEQFIDPEGDMYFPFLLVLEYFFYMGWLKVAETMINPFGDDDDDFEINWMIDRHIKTTYLIVDLMKNSYPKLTKDPYWDDIVPKNLQYTVGSKDCMKEGAVESTFKINVKAADADILIEPVPITVLKMGQRSGENVDGHKGLSWRNRRSSTPKMQRHRPVNKHLTSEIIEMEEQTLQDTLLPRQQNQKNSAETAKITSDTSDFDKLKEQRQQKRAQKFKKYLMLLKKSDLNVPDEEKLISEIMHDQ